MQRTWRQHTGAAMICLAQSAALWTQAHAAAGTSGAAFLKLGAGARAEAMGSAYVSVAEGPSATYWNPAGLVWNETAEVEVSHANWLVDTRYQYAGAVFPGERSALGLSLFRLDYGSLDRYSVTNIREGHFSASSLAAGLSFSQRMSNELSIGATARYIEEAIADEKGSTLAGDAGLLYKTPRYRLGASVQNLGPQIKIRHESYDLPLAIRAGGSTTLFEERLSLAFDVWKYNDNDISLGAGADYHPLPYVAFRVGYKVTPGNNLDVDGLTHITGGFGIQYERFQFDYAIVPFGDLGITHRFSLRLLFGEPNHPPYLSF